ncbi:hypothetical protein GIB67_006787, partial [Kingdonia uniflora]
MKYLAAIDISSAVEELHGLGSQEINKLLRNSEDYVLHRGTESGSLLQIDIEKLTWSLPLHLIAVLVSAGGDEIRLRYLLRGFRLLHSLCGLASQHTKLEQSDLVESDLVAMAEGPNATDPAQVLAQQVGGPSVNPRPLNTRTRLDQLEDKMQALSGIIDQVTTLEERLDGFSDDQAHVGERLVTLEGVVEGNMATLLDQIILEEVKVTDQVLDLVFYMLIVLVRYEQEDHVTDFLPLLHSALVACSFHILTGYISSQWEDLVLVLLAHPK